MFKMVFESVKVFPSRAGLVSQSEITLKVNVCLGPSEKVWEVR